MTEKEIIQALRCGEDANGTPRPEPGEGEIVCYDSLKLAAADLIERLTAENVVLPDGEASAIESLRKEIEWKDMVIAIAQRKQAEAEAERDALREKQRWIPVTERLPEKQGWYHVAIRDEKTKRIAVEIDLYSIETAKNFGHEIGFCKDGRWDVREKVIAWMPLPKAPEDGDT